MLMLNNNEKKKFDILEAKRLYNSGMTLSEIANIYGYKTHKSIADVSRLMYEINSAEPINIFILLNSVCRNGIGPDFKVKRLINFFDS